MESENPLKTIETKTEWERHILRAHGGIPGLENYTGTKKTLGRNTYLVFPYAARQLLFLFAEKGFHPSSHLIGANETAVADYIHVLKRKKALSGLKVIDLGCGILPAFARCAREFGAEVYTVDVLAAEMLVQDYLPDQRSKTLERESHIRADLNRRESIEYILERSDGPFDVATSAKLDACSDNSGELIFAPENVWGIAWSLLKPKKTYYNADRDHIEIKILHESLTLH